MLKKIYPLMTGIILFAITVNADIADSLLFLRNNQMEIGISPRLSGNVQVFRRPGGPNLIQSAPAMRENQLPSLSDYRSYVNCYGHVTWLSPQEHWWTSVPNHHDPLWPPDPYWNFCNSKILKCSSEEIILEIPHSPVSRITMYKKFQLLDKQSIRLTVSIRNSSAKPVSWSIWSNTRINPNAEAYVQVAPNTPLKIHFDLWEPASRQLLQYSLDNDILSLPRPVMKHDNHSLKVGLIPARAAYLVRLEGLIFIKIPRSPLLNTSSSSHSPFEIYRNVSSNPANEIFELEFHSCKTVIPPGDTSEFIEDWFLISSPQPSMKIAQFFTNLNSLVGSPQAPLTAKRK